MRAWTRPLAEVRVRWGRDECGVSAVEFALILPLMLLIYLGGFELSQALSANRKVTITTRAVVDLASQCPILSNTDVSNMLNASAQVMAPFSTSGLSIVLSELATTDGKTATVTWSYTLSNNTVTPSPNPPGPPPKLQLPPNVAQPNSSVLLSQVTFNYVPPIGYALTGPFTMFDQLYMAPRKVASIPAPSPQTPCPP